MKLVFRVAAVYNVVWGLACLQNQQSPQIVGSPGVVRISGQGGAQLHLRRSVVPQAQKRVA